MPFGSKVTWPNVIWLTANSLIVLTKPACPLTFLGSLSLSTVGQMSCGHMAWSPNFDNRKIATSASKLDTVTKSRIHSVKFLFAIISKRTKISAIVEDCCSTPAQVKVAVRAQQWALLTFSGTHRDRSIHSVYSMVVPCELFIVMAVFGCKRRMTRWTFLLPTEPNNIILSELSSLTPSPPAFTRKAQMLPLATHSGHIYGEKIDVVARLDNSAYEWEVLGSIPSSYCQFPCCPKL